MRKIQVYSIRLTRFYIVLIALIPLWIVIPVLLQIYGGYQAIAVLAGLGLLTGTALIAQRIARKEITLSITDNTVLFDEISVPVHTIATIKINKTGIGTTAIEFNLKTGEKSILTLPNYNGNAEKAIKFVEENLPDVEQVIPEDLLG